MAEYIEREAAIAEITAEAEKEGKKSFHAAERGDTDISVKYTHGEYCCLVAAHIVETIPAADVAPVIHGCWKNIGGDEWCCNCCGYVKTTEGRNDRPTCKFCPDCGARMDGESADTNGRN